MFRTDIPVSWAIEVMTIAAASAPPAGGAELGQIVIATVAAMFVNDVGAPALLVCAVLLFHRLLNP
jgi:hypothetical protein